ncbi:MAG: argininosuccinate lyase [Bacteroidota bacterium]|nr:argininosuccinate lyase [Bacteroidota bacterium]
MSNKLWAKNVSVSEQIEKFTTGKDRVLDLYLAKYDVLGSIAHITMLETIHLLTKNELEVLKNELIVIYKEIESDQFTIEEGVEDIHSQIEITLTKRLGDIGKKIHSGRSRNDQVLVDLKLYMRDQLEALVVKIQQLFVLLQKQSEKYKDVILPGYTHFQVAMPSSFGLWFGAYAEALVDDLEVLLAAYKTVDRNPLGSAAGYGSSFPLNRTLTTELLGFSGLNNNVVYAQMTRGKVDSIVANALGSVAYTINKLATDSVLYVSQNFDFIKFPEELMEGSSIMPHKKNPDVFELIRAKTNQIKSIGNNVNLLTTNMPSGYHRDWQILKEYTIPAFQDIKSCIELTISMLEKVEVNEKLAIEEKYKYMYSVDRVNELVLQGTVFRDAYKMVGEEINSGKFKIPNKVTHTHEGSMGNLMNKEIAIRFGEIVKGFQFENKNKAFERLLS